MKSSDQGPQAGPHKRPPNRIREPLDAYSLFVRADMFLLAVNKLPLQINYSFPIIVFNSFAAEAYLKSLAILEGKRPYSSHELDVLFSDISAALQIHIEQRWNAVILPQQIMLAVKHKDNPMSAQHIRIQSLRSALEDNSKSFVEWRYPVPEDDSRVRNYTIFGLPGLIRGAVRTIKPNWFQSRHSDFDSLGALE